MLPKLNRKPTIDTERLKPTHEKRHMKVTQHSCHKFILQTFKTHLLHWSMLLLSFREKKIYVLQTNLYNITNISAVAACGQHRINICFPALVGEKKRSGPGSSCFCFSECEKNGFGFREPGLPVTLQAPARRWVWSVMSALAAPADSLLESRGGIRWTAV